MPSLTLGLIQTYAGDNAADNRSRTRDKIAEAAKAGATVVCTQELFATPYFCRRQDPALFDLAEPIDGPTGQMLSKAAKENKTVVVGSIFEDRGGDLYHNTALLYDVDGSLLGIYRKMHIPQDPGFEEKFYFTPGDTGFRVFKTRFGRVGVLVCWDQWYPEAARLTALAGAQVLLYPTAIGWLKEEKASLGAAQHCAWETVQRGHAVANGCYVAAVNRIGVEGETEFWGQSFVANPYGELIAKASADREETLIVPCDLKLQSDFRRIWPFFRDRRIDAYTDIAQRKID